MTCSASADLYIKGITALIGLGALIAATESYRRNSRTKRAEFLISLHKTFFIDGTFANMKRLLDSDNPADRALLEEEVIEESVEFTDFLNFFELIAYFADRGALRQKDAYALLGYYFDLLGHNPSVNRYIKDGNKGFENLSQVLETRAKSRLKKRGVGI